VLRSPLVPGHQVVGRVAGRGPDATRFREGDRVGIAWLRRTCGRCLYCATDRENLCERAEFTGWHADGGYAELAVVHEDYAYPIPAAFDDVQAAPLLCAGIIGYRALKLAAVRPGGRLGMYGFGSSAHVTIQLARGRNMEVYVCTREPSHRALATELGAAWVGDLREPMPHRTEGTILFAPAGELVPVALRNLARGGTLALAGIYLTPIARLEYEADPFYERGIRSVTANTRADGAELLAEAARGPVRVTTTEFPLEVANQALELLKQGAITGSGVLLTEEGFRV
jgi:propanol-preferring alcohol dehydrogenase